MFTSDIEPVTLPESLTGLFTVKLPSLFHFGNNYTMDIESQYATLDGGNIIFDLDRMSGLLPGDYKEILVITD
jgi:hypothetical protein